MRFLLFALVSGLLCACSSTPVGEDYQSRIDQEQAAFSPWQSSSDAVFAITLNQLVSSPAINSLIAQVLTANPSLAQARVSLQTSRLAQSQAAGARLPTLDVELSAARTEGGSESYGGGLQASWELDLWLKKADQHSQAKLNYQQQRALFEATRTALVSSAVQQWLNLVRLRRNLSFEQQRVVALQHNEQIIVQRYRKGLGNLGDLHSARSSALSAEATLAELQENYHQQRRLLEQLCGASPLPEALQQALQNSEDFPAVALPLADVPRQTLAQRPDLQAAYLNLAEARIHTRIAYKNLLPSLNLSASLEALAEQPDKLFSADPVWALLGGISAPLFRAGQLKAEADIASLQTEQAYQAYRQTLLAAVTEIRDLIGQEDTLNRRLALTAEALELARSNLQRYQTRYSSGLESILDLLSVQQQAFDLETRYQDLLYQRLANRMTLGAALGLTVVTPGSEMATVL